MPHWLEHQYPALRCQREGTPFTLGEDMGLGWEHQSGTSWAPPGRAGSLRAGPGGDQTTGQRFSCHFISTLTNRGSLRFQVFASRAATCFWSFCAPWCARARAKSFSWLTLNPCMEGTASRSGYRHWEHMELFYLPPYRPERNPEEYFHQEILAHATRQRRPRNTTDLKQAVRSYLHQLQQWPEKLSHFFWPPQVQDAGI